MNLTIAILSIVLVAALAIALVNGTRALLRQPNNAGDAFP